MRPIGLQICWVYMRIVRRMVLSEMETKECFHEGARRKSLELEVPIILLMPLSGLWISGVQKRNGRMRMHGKGTAAFGVRYLTPEMYLDYELKSIQLAFATYKGEMVGNHKCHVYTEDEKRAFYDANQDLFTRYHGDLFSYEEVDLIIEKWLKVQEYQDIIESVVANTHLNETTVNEISAQDVSDEKSDNAVRWITEFEKIWNQMQEEKRLREDKSCRKKLKVKAA